MLTKRLISDIEQVQQATLTLHQHRCGRFNGYLLRSNFQPIYSTHQRRIIGHEGLLRATGTDGRNLPPNLLFSQTADICDEVFLDRLCRYLHIQNYLANDDGKRWLFLNISPQVILYHRDFGPYFAELLSTSGIHPSRIVIEIMEGAIPDHDALNRALDFYRNIGCLVALDDFGSEASDIERIWRVAPDIVKLDRRFISNASENGRARRILTMLCGMIHEAGSLVLIEGIETAAQAAIALDCNADLVQGYFYAKPATLPLTEGDGGMQALPQKSPLKALFADRVDAITPYIQACNKAVSTLKKQASCAEACKKLLEMPDVYRCYLIDEDGIQIGDNLLATHTLAKNPRYLQLEGIAGSDWSRRPYYYRAITQPYSLQISRPYLSAANSGMCITLSIAFAIGDRLQVLCCDINNRDDELNQSHWKYLDGNPD